MRTLLLLSLALVACGDTLDDALAWTPTSD